MKTIAIMSPKGGIGKTTTACSLACLLAAEGKKILVIEGDPQGDTSKTFGCYEPEGAGMSELLERHVNLGGQFKTTDLIKHTPYYGVDIIPGNGYLMQTDIHLLTETDIERVFRLKEALQEVTGQYDYCICDCGRLFDMVVINILMASRLIIAPVKVGGYEIEALAALKDQIEDLKELNPDLKIKCILTMRQKNKTSLEMEDWLKTQSGYDVFQTPVRRSIVAEKATIQMAPLPYFSKNGIATKDYKEIVAELEGMEV